MHRKTIVVAIATVMAMASFVFAPAAFADYETGVDKFTYNGYTIPAYDGDPSEIVNGNSPKFSVSEKQGSAKIIYGNKDSKGRCTAAYGLLNKSLMPTWSRGSISTVYPTGWKQKQYDNVPGKYLYNRCHLVGWQLTGADLTSLSKDELSKNLITGTRYLNVGDGKTGMVEYENKAASYLKASTNNFLAYKVTPVFEGNDLVAKGVLMEAESVGSAGVKYCVFCYNVQPGIAIDYATGDSKLASAAVSQKSISGCTMTLTPSVLPYTGKYKNVTIKLKDGSVVLSSGKDYTAKYANNKYPGKARVNIAGIGSYSGSRTGYFYIVPARGSVKATSPAKKKLKMTAAKKTGASGYQFAYKKVSASTWKMATQKERVKTVKGLKKKAVYETKVRAYVTIDGKKYYGKWSPVKKCKIKK